MLGNTKKLLESMLPHGYSIETVNSTILLKKWANTVYSTNETYKMFNYLQKMLWDTKSDL